MTTTSSCDVTELLARNLDTEITRIAANRAKAPDTATWTEAERAANIDQVVSWTAEQRAAFADSERRILERYAQTFVHIDERVGVQARAAATWPWSFGGPGADPLVHALARARLSVVTPWRIPLAITDIVNEWVLEGFNRNKTGHGWVHQDEQFACLYLALPESVQHARYTRYLIAQLAGGHQYMISTLARPTIKAHTKKDADEATAGALAEAMRLCLVNFQQAADALLTGPAPQTASEADALAVQLTEAFAAHIEPISTRTKKLAAGLRKVMQERVERNEPRWTSWLRDPEGPAGELCLLELAKAFLKDGVHAQLERISRNPEALAITVYDGITRVHSRAHKLEEKDGQRSLLFSAGEPVIIDPVIREDAMTRVLQYIATGSKLLGSVMAHRVLRWEVSTGYERVMRGETDARVIVVDGGWTALAERLGAEKKSDVEAIKAIVHTQGAIMLTLPTGALVRILQVNDYPAYRARRAKVEIILGTMLLPHYVKGLPKDVTPDKKRLVPLVDLPPFVGRPNDHGAQATASMLLMREFRTKAKELHRTGAVHIPLPRWAELFREAQLPAALIGKVIDRWTQDGDDSPAFLRLVDAERYTLGEAYDRARAFLDEAGKLEIDRSAAGQISTKKRRQKLDPKGE